MSARPDSLSRPSRRALEAAIRKLESSQGNVQERLALAEARFRMAVLPDTEIDAAIELLRQAMTGDPYHPKFPFHLGRLMHKNGDPQGAVFEYRRALRLTPRSHRTWVHLALALNDLSGDEQTVGLGILEALQTAADDRLAEIAHEIDELIARRLGEKSKADSRKTEPPPKPGRTSSGRCRWKGLWKLVLIHDLSRPKPVIKAAVQRLEEGKSLVEGQQGISEYAVATLFFLLDNPKASRQIRGWLRERPLSSSADHPAVRLVSAACELGDAANAEEFVERASAYMTGSEIPPELVCCLHYSWYGDSANIDPVKAIDLLERYPENFRSLLCFRELAIAILDHHARLAWSADRLDRAEILWRETVRIDPFRIPVAHNLALAVTRAKALERYSSAWERCVELRYLLAASAGDPRVEIDDRRRLHKSFMQQSRLRHVSEDVKKPTPDHLRAWMKDRDALDVWLREGALEYLNGRLRLLSPVHLLGVTNDCSDQDAETAKEAFLHFFSACLQERKWAGSQVFLKLVEDLAGRCCAEAKNPLARKRDAYYAAEEADAGQLADEAIVRGFLMFDMMQLAAKSDDEDLKSSGLEIARFLLMMPWHSLEPLAKKKGRLNQDTNLIPVFVSYVSGLALSTRTHHGEKPEGRVRALKDCIHAVPDAVELRLVLCRLFLETKENRQAYHTALEALSTTAKMADRKEAADIQAQLVICIDNAALGEIPPALLSPTRDTVPSLIEQGKQVLAEFPKAAALRFLIARYLIQIADDDRNKLVEAQELLENGFDQLITDEQIREARQLLEKAGSRSKSFDALKEIRSLLESAAGHARAAMTVLQEGRTPAKVRQARDEIEIGLGEASRAEETARAEGLAAAVENAKELASNLRKILEEIEKG